MGLSLVLAGCASATPTALPIPTPGVNATDTPSPAATAASSASPTPSATATPDAPFSQSGPWLLVHAPGQSDPAELWAANEDGTALRAVVGEAVHVYAIRPDRNAAGQVEVAYVTSSDGQGREDLALKLLTLPDGQVRLITPLTSDATGWNHGAQADTSDHTRLDIAQGLYEDHLAWSPDGKWLAFGAAVDGPSIDVYSYEAEDGQVRRLTSGPGHALQLVWSDNSRAIVHNSIKCFACADYTVSGLWAAKPDGSGVIQLDAPVDMDNLSIIRQIAPDTFIAATSGQDGIARLRIATLSNGLVRYLARDFGSIDSLAVDPADHVAIVGVLKADGVFAQPGWYLVDQIGHPTLLPGIQGFLSAEWDPAARLFVMAGERIRFGVTPDGKKVNAPDYKQIPSPDGALTALVPDVTTPSAGVWLRRQDGAVRQVWPRSADRYLLSWSPDSQSLLYASPAGLLVMHAPDFDPVSIGGGLVGPNSELSTWDAAWTP